MPEFNKKKYWENRKKGWQGQSDHVYVLPDAPKRKKDESGAYVAKSREKDTSRLVSSSIIPKGSFAKFWFNNGIRGQK